MVNFDHGFVIMHPDADCEEDYDCDEDSGYVEERRMLLIMDMMLTTTMLKMVKTTFIMMSYEKWHGVQDLQKGAQCEEKPAPNRSVESTYLTS